MQKISKYAITAATVIFASASASAGPTIPLPVALGDTLNSFADSALLAVVAVGVIGGIWLVRRKQ